MTQSEKSPGQKAYEADVAARPTYDDGTQRKAWDDLCKVARWSWERSPAAYVAALREAQP